MPAWRCLGREALSSTWWKGASTVAGREKTKQILLQDPHDLHVAHTDNRDGPLYFVRRDICDGRRYVAAGARIGGIELAAPQGAARVRGVTPVAMRSVHRCHTTDATSCFNISGTSTQDRSGPFMGCRKNLVYEPEETP